MIHLSGYGLFRAYGCGRFQAFVKTVVMVVFRRAVPVYPKYWFRTPRKPKRAYLGS